MSIISAVFNRGLGVSAPFTRLRHDTERLCLPLSVEDHVVQSMPDASPTKWHLAHTSWFFETFLLKPFAPDYVEFDRAFAFLFNSYYESVGPFHARPKRGLLVRPDVSTVYRYRDHVTAAMQALLAAPPREARDEIERRTWLGIHHEQQHQELLLTDVKHLYAANPLRSCYRSPVPAEESESLAAEWVEFEGGLSGIGFEGREFAFDNERPRHRVWIEPFALQNRLVTNREYLAFIESGGYHEATLWLSDGWAACRREQWEAPLYWERHDGHWRQFTLFGERELRPEEPVCHLSYYEADAYARWVGARLPTEMEWELAAVSYAVVAPEREQLTLHPEPVESKGGLRQMFGETWQWTSSAYVPYPGYRTPDGSLGEYNAKFMCNQQVLRGSSCITPLGHARTTYRNFFPAETRWQFSGLRLAR